MVAIECMAVYCCPMSFLPLAKTICFWQNASTETYYARISQDGRSHTEIMQQYKRLALSCWQHYSVRRKVTYGFGGYLLATYRVA